MNEHLTLFKTYAEYVAFKNTPEAMALPHVSYIENMSICYYHPWVQVLHPVIRATFNATADNMMPITQNYGVIKNLKIDGENIFTASSVSNTQTFNIKGDEVTYDLETQICTCPQNYLVDLTDDIKAIRLTVTPKNIEECSGFGIIYTGNGITSMLTIPINEIESYLGMLPLGYNQDTCTLALSTIFITQLLAALLEMNIDNISCICLKDIYNTNSSFSTIDTVYETLIVKGETMTADDLIPHVTEGVHEIEVELVDNASIEVLFGGSCITNVTYMEDVLTIGEYAFSSCTNLTSVTIPDSVTSIGNSAFRDCTNLTSITIPDNITSIGYNAFSSCTSLTSITIPDNVTSIGGSAFYYCKNLTSVTIGDSVTSIGSSAFEDCTSLTSVNIPDSVTTIGERAFKYCTSLTSVNIPDSVTTIGDEAFDHCSSLTSITIPDSVTTIGDCAFYYCDNLTSVTIPDNVTSIGYNAFYSCDSLTSVNIPDSVTSIGYSAFYSCDSLTSVYCKATTPPALGDSYVFDYNGSGRKIYVPMASVDAYKTANGWNKYASDIEGYEF